MDASGTAPVADDATRRLIENFIVDYAHMIDDDRLEEWPDYFTEACTYRIIDRVSHAKGRSIGVMECSSRGMLKDRIKALREANVYEPHFYRHLLSGTRIRGEKDGAWMVETSYAIVRTMQEGDISMFNSGKYIDEIVIEDGRPLFRSRVIVCDSQRFDTLVVIPI
jgi:anthranilate 1,2-dioxygenase small subunit